MPRATLRRFTVAILWMGAATILIAACTSSDDGSQAEQASADEQAAVSQAASDEQVATDDGYGGFVQPGEDADGAPEDAPEDEGVEGLSEEQPAEANPSEAASIPQVPTSTVLGALFSVSEIKITPSDPESNDEFGWSLGVGGNTLVSGAPLSDDKGGNSGTAYIFNWDGRSWTESTKLVAEDGREGDWVGKSAAVSGDTAVVGANRDA